MGLIRMRLAALAMLIVVAVTASFAWVAWIEFAPTGADASRVDWGQVAAERAPLALGLMVLLWLPGAWILRHRERRRRHRHALAARQHAMHQATLDAIQDAVLTIEPDGRVTELNPAARRLLGRTLDEARGRELSTLFKPLDPETRRPFPVMDQITADDEAAATDDRPCALLTDGHGRERWVWWTHASMRDASGTWHGSVLVIRDITEAVLDRARMEKTQEQYQLALKGSRDGLWDWNIRDDSLFLSPQWMAQVGYADGELPGHIETFKDLLHPEDRETVFRALDDYLVGRHPFYAVEFRLRHRDGGYRWFLARGEALRDNQGRVYRMAGFHTDITDRKEAEEALARSERRFRSLVERAAESVFVLDRNGCFTYVAPNWQSLFGESPEVPLGRHFETYLHPEDRPAIRMLVEDLFAGRRTQVFTEYRVLHTDGSVRWHLGSAAALHDENGQISGLLGLAQDMTERKGMEQALRESNRALATAIKQSKALATRAEMASQAKSAFLSNMSHEIRTPMNAVIGMLGLLLDSDLTPQQRRYAETAQTSGESLLALINDILDFSKIEARKLELETIDFDLHALLDTFADSFALAAERKGLELIRAVSPDVPRRVRGDPGRLRQVLTNLTGNAIKFTQSGEVEVRIRPESAGADVLRFSVRDTGIGIPDDKRDALFTSFTQLDPSTTRRFGGTGLGLAISKQLVELMGGEIGVNSPETGGAEFWFNLPLPEASSPESTLDRSPDPLAGVRAPVAPLANGEQRASRILVVDDTPTNHLVALGLLDKFGYRADTAENGADALAALAERDYDLVLLDVQMPVMDGFEAARHIRDPQSAVRDHAVPVIAMTAHALQGDRERCLAAGMDDYLTKPLQPAALAAVLARWLSPPRSPQP